MEHQANKSWREQFEERLAQTRLETAERDRILREQDQMYNVNEEARGNIDHNIYEWVYTGYGRGEWLIKKPDPFKPMLASEFKDIDVERGYTYESFLQSETRHALESWLIPMSERNCLSGCYNQWYGLLNFRTEHNSSNFGVHLVGTDDSSYGRWFKSKEQAKEVFDMIIETAKLRPIDLHTDVMETWLFEFWN